MSEVENCNHDCGSCQESCSSRDKSSFLAAPHEDSHIKKVIGVVSGKGGVGKSMVTSMLAVLLNRRGYKTAILDADVTGPSIPKAFGIRKKATGDDRGILPVVSRTGIKIMSVNLVLEDESTPVIWRGPIIAGTVKQFWTDVIWSDVDFMLVDMPPGTGDVPLTVFQSIPLDGIIVVTSPQELVSMIVEKAVNMANMMDIPILGVIENMSYVRCPDCGTNIKVFGESHIDEIASKYELEVLGKLPIDPDVAKACDVGDAEELHCQGLERAANIIERKCEDKMRIAITTDNDEVFQHFGKCRFFTLLDVVNGKIVSSKLLDADGNGHSALAGLLASNNVNLLICGGIGGGAKEALKNAGIQIISGANGSIESVVKAYLNGSLKDSPAGACSHHEHEGSHTCNCTDHCGH